MWINTAKMDDNRLIKFRCQLVVLIFIAFANYSAADTDNIFVDDFIDPRHRGATLCPVQSSTGDEKQEADEVEEGGCKSSAGESVHVLDVTAGRVKNYVSAHELTDVTANFVSLHSRHYFEPRSSWLPDSMQISMGFTHFYDGVDQFESGNRSEVRIGIYSLYEDTGEDRNLATRSEFRFTYDDLHENEYRRQFAFDTKIGFGGFDFGTLSFSYRDGSDDIEEYRVYSFNEFHCHTGLCSKLSRNARLVAALGLGIGYGNDEFRFLPTTVSIRYEHSLGKYLTFFASYAYSHQSNSEYFIEGSNDQFTAGLYIARFY